MTRVLTIGMHHVNVTQKEYERSRKSTHFKLPAVDLAGEDTGIDFYRALDGKYMCVGTWGPSGGTAFIPIDEHNRPEKTMLADGTIGYYGIYMCHDWSNHYKFSIYRIGDVMYKEGRKGNTTGNHIHLEVFRFDPKNPYVVPKRTQNEVGQWMFEETGKTGPVNPSELWVATDYSVRVDSKKQTFGETTLEACRK